MTAGSTAAVEEAGPATRIGPLTMRPGVTRGHVGTLFFVSFFSIVMMNTVGVMQPYIFNEILKIPPEEQGSLAGGLMVLQEVVVLLLIGPAGAASDRIGRPPVFAAGFALLAVGYCLYPLASGPPEMAKAELAIFRLFLASGIAGVNVMLASVVNDYPVEASRARMIAAVFIFNGLGIATLPRLIGSLPQFFIDRGVDPVWGGRYAFWFVAVLCVMLAVVLMMGLKPGAPAQLGKREPLLATLRVGLNAARRGRVALAYAAGVVSRADLAVVGTFLTLWLVREGLAQGLTTAEAIKRATLFYVFVQAMAIPWAPVWGWILDRVDRVKGLAAAMTVAGVGYASLGLLDDPIGWQMYLAAAGVGMGEMAANISATSLIGKEAPDRGRGAVIGIYSLCGALGIMIVAVVGGWLFDHWRPVGPFVFMAAANLLMVVLALITLVATRPGVAASNP